MICGFLDPNGKLYACCRYEHTTKAEKIVWELHDQLQKGKPYDIGEEILLRNGWICIRTGDVYKGIYSYDEKILFITDAQQKFFADHKQELNERQIADIEMLLRDFGKLYEWHKED